MIAQRLTPLRKAALDGALLSLEQRKALLKKLRGAIESQQGLLKDALKQDLGKSAFEAWTSEIGYVIEEIDFTIKHMDEWAAPEKVPSPITIKPASSWIHKDPYGVVLIIGPWNYPLQLCVSPLVGALAAGNQVVIKPSEFTPATAVAIERLIASVFESHQVIVVQGGVQETTELLKEKFDYIFFTGSTRIGKVVMKAAAEHLTPVTLELGGKSPCIVDETANIDVAAKRIVWGKFMNAGQTCVAPDYVYAHASVHDQLVSKMKEVITQFYGADPSQSPDYVKVVNERHLDRLLAMTKQGKMVCGGRHDKNARYMEPTILTEVDWEHTCMQEEIFGPLLPVMSYRDFSEVKQQIKQHPKPLACYYFTEDNLAAKNFLEQVSFGGGCINDTIVHLANPHLPFGGVGESGIGNYHGAASFTTFSHSKSVVKQTTLVDIPLRYPPYGKKESFIKYIIG